MSAPVPPPTAVRPDPGVYIIKSKLRGTNITLKGGVGTTVTAWAPSTDIDQQWQIAHLGKGEYSIISNKNGYAISSANGSGKVAIAEFLPPHETKIRWIFAATGTPDSGNLYIQKTNSTDVIDLSGSFGADGTPILVWPRHLATKPDNQIWNLIPV